MGRKKGSKDIVPRSPEGEGTGHGSKSKVLAEVTQYLANPDAPMVESALAYRLAQTRHMDVSPNKMFEDGGHKIDVVRFIAAKCSVTVPPATPDELYRSLDNFLEFCVMHGVPPTLGLFCVWNGITQQRYGQIERDVRDVARGEAFSNAKETIRSFLELAALEGSANALLYFHANKTQYGFVENQQVTVRVEDNSRELTDDERSARVQMLMQEREVTMVQGEDGVFRAED